MFICAVNYMLRVVVRNERIYVFGIRCRRWRVSMAEQRVNLDSDSAAGPFRDEGCLLRADNL